MGCMPIQGKVANEWMGCFNKVTSPLGTGRSKVGGDPIDDPRRLNSLHFRVVYGKNLVR